MASLQCQRQEGPEPLAIVGMACRLPGGIAGPSDLWQLLVDGRSGRGEIPVSRFHGEAFYHPDPQYPTSINAAQGFFLDGDVRRFDNDFFGINNLEAQHMDPQQRQLLEVSFECLESAGIPLSDISDAKVGCFVANFTTDFAAMQTRDPELLHRYSWTGMGAAILANRISHAFNLKGPSVTVDTACSGSLAALHFACTALRQFECDGAIVGGANLIQSPEAYMAAVKAGVISGTSVCHTFDAAADGYARAEGVGALYIKRLSDAVRDGDPIRSVIRGTALNSNGKTNGILLPSADGQVAVIQAAYANAGLRTNRTDYVEAHGTGTEVGDAIEVEAISRALQHQSGRPTLIGSVKTNLGHAEAVSGITSIIKVTLALENGQIPATIGVQTINPKLQLEDRNARIALSNTDWPESECWRASINSFGYGGANGHVVLEGARHEAPPAVQGSAIQQYYVLPVSAHSSEALHAREAGLRDSLERGMSIDDLALTLTIRRSSLSCRSYLLCKQTLDGSERFVRASVPLPPRDRQPSPRFVFVFTGQGSQWPQMGLQLLRRFPSFRKTIGDLSEHLSAIPVPPSWQLQDVLEQPAEASVINQAAISQTACTAVQIALLELLKLCHIQPSTVIGHSSGEVAAAYAAGYLTAREAIHIAYYRGLAVSSTTEKGAMAAVGLSQKETMMQLQDSGYGSEIDVACINSPRNTTVSGYAAAVEGFVSYVDKQGVFVRRLNTGDRAYHSKLMQAASPALAEALATVFDQSDERAEPFPVKMISTVFARTIDRSDVVTAEYWRTNMLSPVRFSDALKQAMEPDDCCLVEIGPHNALKSACKETLKALDKEETLYVPTMSRGRESDRIFLDILGQLFLHGYKVPLDTLNSPSSSQSLDLAFGRKLRVLTDLPSYRWDHSKLLWSEGRVVSDYRSQKYPRHDLLGSMVPGGSGKTSTWRSVLRVDNLPWLADHKLDDSIVFPAAGYLAMGLEAFAQAQSQLVAESSTVRIHDARFMSFLVFRDRRSEVEVFTELVRVNNSLTSPSSHLFQFTVSTFDAGVSTTHATAYITTKASTKSIPNPSGITKDLTRNNNMHDWYEAFRREGLNFGDSFQRLREVSFESSAIKQQAVSHVSPYPHARHPFESKYFLHPTYIDALLQTSILSAAAGQKEQLRGRVPVAIESATFTTNTLGSVPHTIYACSRFEGTHAATSHSAATDPDGSQLLEIDGLKLIPWKQSRILGGSEPRQPLLQELWKPDISTIGLTDHLAMTRYLHEAALGMQQSYSTFEVASTAAMLDLCCHKWPGALRVLHLTPSPGEDVNQFSELFQINSSLKRVKSYQVGHLDDTGALEIRDWNARKDNMSESEQRDAKGARASFDIVFATSSIPSDRISIRTLLQYCIPGGRVVLPHPWVAEAYNEPAWTVDYTFAYNGMTPVTLASLSSEEEPKSRASHKLFMICSAKDRVSPPHTIQTILDDFCDAVQVIEIEDLCATTIPSHAVIVCALELEQSILEHITPQMMRNLQSLVEREISIIWLQHKGFLSASNPCMSLAQGLARTLRMEHPSIRFVTLDMGGVDAALHDKAFKSHLRFVIQEVVSRRPMDLEYVYHNATLFIGRFSPIPQLNQTWNARLSGTPIKGALANLPPSQVTTMEVGRLEGLHFTPLPDSPTELPAGHVEVCVKAIGLNAKDYYALKGIVHTREGTTSLEFSGIIIRAGSVSGFHPGDRVVAMAPNKFQNYVSVPGWACHRLEDHEDFTTMATVPIVFATALYALHHRARIQAGETILIHSAAGGVGIAAIQVAKLAGATILATAGTPTKRDYLVREYGLRPEHVFARDDSFHLGVLEATDGYGVDVVLNCLTGDLLRATWELCAPFGRFIDISRKDADDHGRLDMGPFGRSASYHGFDLTDIYYAHSSRMHELWQSLIQRSLSLVRSGAVQPVQPLKVFDVSEMVQAFQHFGAAERTGKVAVSFQREDALVSFCPARFACSFSPSKTYLLVGCLGGLGRCITRWMLDQGARHFAFLSRSGASSRVASEHIQALQACGASVQIVPGDVAKYADVQYAVAAVDGPIAGVIHAAMELHNGLFTSQMTSCSWQAGIAAKVQGAWNLHRALDGQDAVLDFFLLTSSVTGSIGLVAESNYSAANAFLDHFARYRRSLGLPAVSVGLGLISGAGYVSEQPEISAMLQRKGIHAYDEQELLQTLDTALAPSLAPSPHSHTHSTCPVFDAGHLLTGLELSSLRLMLSKGVDPQNTFLHDPRAGLLAAALAASSSSDTTATAALDIQQHTQQHLATAVAAAAADPAAIPQLQALVESTALDALAALLLESPQTLRVDAPLAAAGMDSMVAAEFRAALFHAGVGQVPLTVLLGEGMCVRELAGWLVVRMLGEDDKRGGGPGGEV